MITENNILDIIDECRKKGYSVRVRDIAYVFLCEHFADRSIAYRSLNGSDGVNVDTYHESPEITFLRDHIKYNVNAKENKRNIEKSKDELSFEQNKKEMQGLIDRFEEGMADGTIEPAVGLAKIADIRVKLNDKFNVNEVVKDQIVVVEPKYNMICERYNVECYLPTKEQLMKMYNLKPADE